MVAQGKPGTAESHNDACAHDVDRLVPGMVICNANGTDFRGMPYNKTIEALQRIVGEAKAAGKQVTLVFADLERLLRAFKARAQARARRLRAGSASAGGGKQPAAGGADSKALSPAACRKALQELFGRHNPSKLPEIDKLLEKYKGKERLLVVAVQNKYENPNESSGAAPGAQDAAGQTKPQGSQFALRRADADILSPIPRHQIEAYDALSVKALKALLEKVRWGRVPCSSASLTLGCALPRQKYPRANIARVRPPCLCAGRRASCQL